MGMRSLFGGAMENVSRECLKFFILLLQSSLVKRCLHTPMLSSLGSFFVVEKNNLKPALNHSANLRPNAQLTNFPELPIHLRASFAHLFVCW